MDPDEYLDSNGWVRLDEYLTLPKYNKCDGIKLPWLQFDDNDELFYKKRFNLERFPRFVMKIYDVDEKIKNLTYCKHLIRGNLSYPVYISVHIASIKNGCDNEGKPYDFLNSLVRMTYDGVYARHYYTRTAEEYVIKKTQRRSIDKGNRIDTKEKLIHQLKKFFVINKKTMEKIRIFEKAFSTTFPVR